MLPEPSESTFLFLDLVGFTALTAEHGDARAAEIAIALYGTVRAVLEEHDAREVKTIGDAMMLRCRHPASAVKLGLRVVSELESVPELPAVRVGIHSGPAIEHSGDWYGATVNVAARLCSAAGGGEVLVSDVTRRAAGRIGGVTFGEQRLHWLKNVTEPVVAHSAFEPEQRAVFARFARRPTRERANEGWQSAQATARAVRQAMAGIEPLRCRAAAHTYEPKGST